MSSFPVFFMPPISVFHCPGFVLCVTNKEPEAGIKDGERV